MHSIKNSPCMYNNTISQVDPIVNEDSLYMTLAKAESKLLYSRDIRNKLKSYYFSIGKIQTASAVESCGTFLMFKQYKNAEKTAKLDKANFCKHPLCPLCSWRRALKYSELVERTLQKSHDYLYHLVLAVPNTRTMSKGQLMSLKSKAVYFLKNYLGVSSYISNLEITKSEFGYHPHLHIIFESQSFIHVSEEFIKSMSSKWMHCYNKSETRYEGYTFYLQGVSKTDDGLPRELTKYVLKADTEIFQDDIEQIAHSIHGIRRMSAGGEFKKNLAIVKKEYKADTDFENMQLSQYDYEYLIFNYINGKYIKH